MGTFVKFDFVVVFWEAGVHKSFVVIDLIHGILKTAKLEQDLHPVHVFVSVEGDK